MTADAKLAARIARMRRGVSAIDAASNLPAPRRLATAAIRSALVAFADGLETTLAATVACEAADTSTCHAVRLLGAYDAGEAKVAHAAEQFCRAAEMANDTDSGALVGLAVGYALEAQDCRETIRSNARRLSGILARARAAGSD